MDRAGADYAEVVAWLRNPGVLIAMILLLAALFHHTALGLQVIVEDYVHSGLKFALMITVRLACYALVVAGVIAVLKIALAAP